MAKNSIRDFDATSGNNTDIQSVDISEGCAASGINNAIREIMVDLKNVSTGAVNLETPGADQLNVDNLRLDGNTISSTDTNGDITLDPNGTGKVIVPAAIEATTSTHANASVFKSTGNTQLFLQDTDASANDQFWGFQVSGGEFNILTCDDDRAGGFVTPVNISQAGLFGIGASSTASTLHVQGNGARVVNSSDTDALHLLSFDNNNHADYFMYTASGNNNVAIRTAEPSFFNGGKVYFGRTGDPFMSTGSVKRLSIDGGTTSTDSTIVSNKDSASTMFHFYFHNSNSVVGSISTNAHATSFNTSSDHRLKENVADITGAIARVKSLQPKRFNWITEPDTTIDGFLAHEAAAVVPESVTGSYNGTRAATGIVKAADGKVLAESVAQAAWTATKGDAADDLYPSDSTWTASEDLPVYQTIDQAKLVPVLTAALKDAIAKLEALETEMTALKARVTALEA